MIGSLLRPPLHGFRYPRCRNDLASTGMGAVHTVDSQVSFMVHFALTCEEVFRQTKQREHRIGQEIFCGSYQNFYDFYFFGSSSLFLCFFSGCLNHSKLL